MANELIKETLERARQNALYEGIKSQKVSEALNKARNTPQEFQKLTELSEQCVTQRTAMEEYLHMSEAVGDLQAAHTIAYQLRSLEQIMDRVALEAGKLFLGKYKDRMITLSEEVNSALSWTEKANKLRNLLSEAEGNLIQFSELDKILKQTKNTELMFSMISLREQLRNWMKDWESKLATVDEEILKENRQTRTANENGGCFKCKEDGKG